MLHEPLHVQARPRLQNQHSNGNLLFYARSYRGEYYFFPPVGDNKIPETINSQMEFMREADELPVVNQASAEFIKKYIEGDR